MNICVRSSTGRREIGDVGGGGGRVADTFECDDGETMVVGSEWDDNGRRSVIIG